MPKDKKNKKTIYIHQPSILTNLYNVLEPMYPLRSFVGKYLEEGDKLNNHHHCHLI